MEICPGCNQEYSGYKWCRSLIEWIPYDRFKDVKQIGRYRNYKDDDEDKEEVDEDEDEDEEEDEDNDDDDDEVGVEMALKKFDNFVNFNDVLNETYVEYASIKFYGITQDPKTHKYMMVLQYAKDGNLREYLKLILIILFDIVHQDTHPGNILSSNFKDHYVYISDFGLSKLIGTNPNNPEKKNVLPYIALEVLIGGEEYIQ
ncbi:hypothetical protein Glove_355g29 [Diversispora epigaea]|uniref:Protein kinase domain-containing protein n=1 Tax=Diversispora epigaea TaxID=1348612 RepID=A0A397HBD6_9GLOM|nr:hypothetical protein Glove_355g29 [Diversispora epigaea]